MNYPFTLEKYNGGRGRRTCPSCGHSKEFALYVEMATGQPIADYVGRCNRQVKCGYHYSPKQFFDANPTVKLNVSAIGRTQTCDTHAVTNKKIDFISNEVFKRTVDGYERNNFIKYLLTAFPPSKVENIIRQYFIGTWKDGRTIFWQIDQHRQIRTGKLMTYDATSGKRCKNRPVSWIHSELKRTGDAPTNFELRQCLFGQHLLSVNSDNPIGIVESEKTAIVASLCLPNILWLATGGSANLRPQQLGEIFDEQRIVLFPDSSKFNEWSAKAKETKRISGMNIKVSELLERNLTVEQKREDFDLADFLMNEKRHGETSQTL